MEIWDRGQQHLGVRMMRPTEDFTGRTNLQDLSEVHHGDAIGDILNDAEVVGHEQIGNTIVRLQFCEQVEHGCLD